MELRRCFLSAFILIMSSAVFGQSSLDNILSISRLPYLKKSKMIQISSYDTTGGNADFITVKNGAVATLANVTGPGVVTQFWCTIDSRDPYFLRRIVLRMYWDGEKNPSVEVPIGDFFGTGFGYKQHISQFVGMSSGGYYSYFPMPFRSFARIEIVNQTGEEINAFYYHIDFQKMEEPLEADVAYFHAQWRRELRTDPKHNYTVLDAEGIGHFVGLNLNMQSYEGNLWFLEGDEMVYVDGEKFPSVYGTGTEDYFTSGWYFNRGEFSAPYHGLILKDDSLGRIAAYRYHVGDAIPFKKSIRFTIEHGHANEEMADYCSTAYWYQKEPHKPFPEMMKASLRIPLRVPVPNHAVEAESLTTHSATIVGRIENMSDFGPDWSGLKQLKLEAKQPGDECTVDIPRALEDMYNVDLYFTQGPDYGNADIVYNGMKVGEIRGYRDAVFPGGKIPLANLRSMNHTLPLKFVVKGKDAKSKGFNIGLDAFVVQVHREFITDWMLIGPFPNPRDSADRRLGLDYPYSPEKEIDFNKTYFGADSQQVKWTLHKTEPSGIMELMNLYTPSELVVVYAVTYIHSPKDQSLPLLLGSDDGLKVLLNGKEIHRKYTIRGADPDQDTASVDLKKGWNTLLLKVENNMGGYAFYARILDSDRSLTFATKKE